GSAWGAGWLPPAQATKEGWAIRRRRLLWYLVPAAWAAAVLICLWVRPRFAGERPIDPFLVRLGPVRIRWYGFLIAVSFIPGFYIAAAEARRKGIRSEERRVGKESRDR